MNFDLSTLPAELSTAEDFAVRREPPVSRHPRALFILDAASRDLIYGQAERAELEARAEFYAPPQTRASIRENPGVLADLEVLFSGWEAALMDRAFLEAAPNLKAVFYGAGTIGYCTSEAFWDREIVISSAWAANAVAVAEYTLGVILLGLKNFWRFSAAARTGNGWGNQTRHMPGIYQSTVALIGCGMIARKVIALLKAFDLHCLVYDPFLTQAEADALGVELCSLDDAFLQADVVSLHAPDKDETHGLITGRHVGMMKTCATFINTARGRIVRETEMIEVLRSRPDLTAVLDVCYPEPAPADSPLLALPNLLLTPHIAGSHGPECRRLGRYMVEEFRRYLAGEPLKWQITRDLLRKLA